MKIVKHQTTSFVYSAAGHEYQTFEDAKIAVIQKFIRDINFMADERHPVEELSDFIADYSSDLLKLLTELEQEHENN